MTIKVKRETAVEEVREACAKAVEDMNAMLRVGEEWTDAGATAAGLIRSLQFEVEDGGLPRLPAVCPVCNIGRLEADGYLVDRGDTVTFGCGHCKTSFTSDCTRAKWLYRDKWLPAPPKAEEGK